ncbi:transposase [Paenibacillus larvae]|nr:transposase [Paenibacillus larvae]MDT2261812.1 transposase [Paenibacillus larvae]
MLFEDESMIRDYQAIQKTWFLRRKQRIIPTTGKHRGVKLLATVDYETGRIVWQEDEQYTAETFLSFLQKVMATYPTGETGSGFGQCPDSSCKAASAVSGSAKKSA